MIPRPSENKILAATFGNNDVDNDDDDKLQAKFFSKQCKKNSFTDSEGSQKHVNANKGHKT
jgi:hypothetical protein